ncbi:hypothetical protein AVEN_42659-1 [Araneus ventricosus]|uniref:Uncharacterized protein n=1 Tax=Araneus ventricosus TaxID=182803 RepID=A0A4Y2BLW7_ARAVE|nr:hypothetical protein AVEN_42659-1 [Araneus ventricosus]
MTITFTNSLNAVVLPALSGIAVLTECRKLFRGHDNEAKRGVNAFDQWAGRKQNGSSFVVMETGEAGKSRNKAMSAFSCLSNSLSASFLSMVICQGDWRITIITWRGLGHSLMVPRQKISVLSIASSFLAHSLLRRMIDFRASNNLRAVSLRVCIRVEFKLA